jgi:hypothetical protein
MPDPDPVQCWVRLLLMTDIHADWRKAQHHNFKARAELGGWHEIAIVVALADWF